MQIHEHSLILENKTKTIKLVSFPDGSDISQWIGYFLGTFSISKRQSNVCGEFTTVQTLS